MFRCKKQCTACTYIKEGSTIKQKKSTWKINKHLNCESRNIVYLIECKKGKCITKNCWYIWESKRPLKYRLADHRGYVLNKTQATGAHFSLTGHSLGDLSVTIIEQVRQKDTVYRKEREKCHIRKLNTFHSGLNKQL